jgi:hypothetical protein
MCQTCRGTTIYGMFGIWKFENRNLYVKCLESKILKTKMSKLGCVENWNLYMKCLEFENLKFEMFKFGCVNTEYWNLKSFYEMFGRNLKF